MRRILFEISLGNIDLYIYSYIFFSVLSVALILVFTFLSFRRNGLNRIVSLAGILMILAFTLTGARLIGVLYKYPFYIDGLDKLISAKYGDFSLFGGLIFAVLGGFLFARITRKDVFKISDDLVFPLGGAIIIWRIGCFLNGCCLGRETFLPWGVCFDEAGTNVHPTQLYEIAAILFILAVLFIIRKKIKRPGILSSIFYILFAIMYLFISYFRERTIYGLTVSLILAIVFIGEVIIIGISGKNKQ